MSQLDHKDFRSDIQIKGIDIISSSLESPDEDIRGISTHNFNISIETRINPDQEIISVLVSITISTPKLKETLGTLKTVCSFGLSNFKEVILINPINNQPIPKPLLDIINSISLSTTRGILFSQFRGTFLHNAILPIIDSKAIIQKDIDQRGAS